MVQLLLSSQKKRKISFEKMVMIGRQNLHLNPDQLKEAFLKFGFKDIDVIKIFDKNNTYAEPLLKAMGADIVDSIDASDYEDASIIHDMSNPVADKYKNQYDLVLDSGTLEHVFNFPVAIKNCMELVKTGGHFIGIYPCNNFFGHGFYQFSSELFYRVLSKENGYNILDVILFTDEKNATFYSVPDTSEEHQRINFTNTKPVLMYVLAEKKNDGVIFENNPLQMDYSKLKWKGVKIKSAKKQKKSAVKIPQYFKNIIKALMNKRVADDKYNFKRDCFREYKL